MEYYGYQDPNTAYGYEGYGYGEYENVQESQEPPPPPDKNWEDPVKTNREYMRKLQTTKSFVHEGFEALSQESVFLLEVQVESFSLKKDVFENEDTADNKGKFHITQVQFWKLPFTEVNGIGETYGEERRSVTRNPNYSQLFESINSFSPKVEITEEPIKTSSVDDNSGSSIPSGSIKESSVLTIENESFKTVEEEEDMGEEESEDEGEMEECIVMKGVSVMLGMTGFRMIQTLQVSPIKIRVIRVEIIIEEDKNSTEDSKVTFSERILESPKSSVMEDNENIFKESLKPREERVESVVAEASVVVPEVLREAVLKGQFESFSGTYKLKDLEGELYVGKVKVSINIKCFGRAVINCMSRWGYDDTTMMTSDPCKEEPVEEERFVPELDNVLVRIFESKQRSSDLLQKCLEQSTKRKCRWYELARDCLPPCPMPDSTSMEELEKQEMEREVAWRKLKQICRKFKTQEPRKNSLYDRLEEVRMPVESDDKMQTGIAVLDVHNPFEDEAARSIGTEKTLSSKRRSTKTSGRSSQQRASKRVSIIA